MLKNIFLILLTFVLLGLAVIFLPIDKINWGRISILPAATITVTGSAQSDIANQTAGFSATISSTNPDKQKAVDDVNTKMTALIKSIKDFGIADADIKTESVNVYQQPQPVPQTLIYPAPPVPAPSRNGDWTASNSITITLHDVSKASGMSDILNKSGATNIYGPNLGVNSNQTTSDAVLLSKAVADAKQKAESIAKAGGQTLGRMINVQESGSNTIYPMMFAKEATGGIPTPIQPGTSTLSKSVTVIFELK